MEATQSHDADLADDCCDHGISHEDHHGCVECVTERADFLLDQMREGYAP